MNKLEEYFFKKQDKECVVHKWHHYFKIYDRHFKRFQGKNPVILEIGVSRGGSLEMWNHYFDKECYIYGVDNAKRWMNTSIASLDNVHLFLGSQGDPKFWKKFKEQAPKFDIIIDDGGHTMSQQITTFECMYDWVKDDGVYLCEDTHTSYWGEWGGGLKKPSTFIEYSKNFIDKLNAYHIRENDEQKGEQKGDLTFRKITNSVHYYDSIVVLEKEIDLEKPLATKR